MMPELPNDPPHADAALDAATRALRDAPVPPGPSPELVARTRAAIARVASADRDASSRFRMVLRPSVMRWAAAVALLSSGAAVTWKVAHRPLDSSKETQVAKKSNSELPVPVPVDPTPKSRVADPELKLVRTLPRPDGQVVPAPPRPEPAPAFPVAEGTISGRIAFAGAVPAMMPLGGVDLMPQCAEHHKGVIRDESIRVDGASRGLANVVVSIAAGLPPDVEWVPPSEPATLDQQGCVFTPHVLAVMVGQPLEVRNSDPFLHNVHLMAVNNDERNIGQPAPGQRRLDPFKVPEVFQVRCDVHPWMRAWVRVLDNPYFAVTDGEGRFTIRNLPPGEYTVKAWHEELGVREQRVTLAADRGAALDFTFRGDAR